MARKIAFLGVMAALSIVLVLLIRMPLFPSAEFLEYDPADIPILIATFVAGTGSGLLLTVVVSVIQGLTVSAKSGLYGILMHIIATGAYVLAAGLIYQRFKSFKGALAGLLAGVLSMTAVMAGANLVVTPLFLGVPVSAVKPMLLPVIIPFNLLKAAINAVPTLLLYKTALWYYRPAAKTAARHT